MHPIAIFDLISVIASLTALTVLIMGWKCALDRDVKFFLAGLFVFNIFYSLCLYAEWSGLTKDFDPYEDIIGAMLPMWWAFVFYAFLQQIASIDLLWSEEKYREFVEGTDDFISQVDREGRLTFVNDTAAKIFGLSKEECMGLSAFNFIHPDDQEKTKAAFEDWIRNRVSSTTFENRQVNQKTGEVHYLHWAINFHYDENTKITGINGIARDITGQVQTREEKEKLQVRLQQAQKMESIATLAGGIAHQFNNALSPISVNIDLLEMDFNEEDISNYIAPIKESTVRMKQLTSQLLGYARGGKYQAQIVSPNDFVKNTLPLIMRTLHTGIDVDTDLFHDIWSIKADLAQMQMVFTAVLQNASEAIEGKGRVKILTRNKRVDKLFVGQHPGLRSGSYVSFKIEDDGKGMDEETKNRVFEPFYTNKFQGRGLGLAAVYGIIKNHNGWISVDSELGKGTIIHILIPAITERLTEITKTKTEPLKGTGTILLVEDEETVLKANRMVLERLGYHVLEARTGKEAVGAAKTFDGIIHLTILDIVLPDMKGNEIYPLLIKARPDMKVIVCSGYSIDGPAQNIIDAGAHGFIQKPFTIANLSEKLMEVLGG